MDKFTAMFNEACKTSFSDKIQKLPEINNDINLTSEQIQLLAEKIAVLPDEFADMLYFTDIYGESPGEVEQKIGITDVESKIKYFRRILSKSIGIPDDKTISYSSFATACTIAHGKEVAELHMKMFSIQAALRKT